MTPQEMLMTPVEKRRGTVTQETGSWAYLLVDAPPERVLDLLLEDKIIGAARRDCLDDVRACKVPRPVGPWGMLARLKGHSWTYVLSGDLRFDWPKQWAAKHGWRVAWFSLDGMINTKIARLYDGEREVFNFVCGLIEAEDGFLFRELDHDTAIIRGEGEPCSQVWLDQLESGGQAMDLLARLTDAYLPVSLGNDDQDGKAVVAGWDGEPYPDEEQDTQQLPDSAFERVDVFTFGGPETLEPNKAAIALSAAVHGGDAEAAKQALADEANPNLMCDDRETPLEVALGLGSPYLRGGRFAKVSLQQQLALLSVLLESGANPDPPGGEPAIHRAIHWANGGDEQTIVAQLRLLLDHGADPNAMGTFLRGAGQRPLHVVANFDQWLAVLKLLVQRGADAKLTNHQGKTPRELAQEKMTKLNESQAKHAPPPGRPQDGAASAATTFVKAITSEDDQYRKQAMKELMGNFLHAASAERTSELDRLKAVVAFLAEAEQGKADVSDIDAIAAASSEQHARARQEEQQKAGAGISVLQDAIKNMRAAFRQSNE